MPDFQIVTFPVEGAEADLKTISYEELVNAYGKIFERIDPARKDELKVDFVQTLILNDLRQQAPVDVFDSMAVQRLLKANVEEFAQDLLDNAEVPIKNSPLGSTDLKSLLLTAGSSVSVVLGSFTTDHNPVVVVAMVGASIVILGAARGVAEALRRGFYVKTLQLLKVPEQSTGSARRRKIRAAS